MSNNNDGHRDQPVKNPSSDLSYLHPDNLDIGSVGVFAGDWAWTGDPPRIPVGFVGVLIDYWNGFAVWRCTREVAQAVAADQQRRRHEERTRHVAQMRQRSGRLGWQLTRLRLLVRGRTRAEVDQAVDESIPPVWIDGDDLVLDQSAQYGEPTIDRQSPGPDGRYCPMGFQWTWQAVDPGDCDRIAGNLPALGEHREFVMATHQPLRMPRHAVTKLDEPTAGQAAPTATLWVDGRPVGTVEIGPGRPAVFRQADDRFDNEDLDEFVRACRWRGREVDTQAVLQALIAEYETALHIVEAENRGFVAVILRDGDDHIVGTDTVLERHRLAFRDRQRLAELLTGREAARRPHQNQFVWQVWTGRRWLMLGIVDLPRAGKGGHRMPRADQAPTSDSPTRASAATPPEALPGSGDQPPDADGAAQNGEQR